MAFDINVDKQRKVAVSYSKADGSPGEVEGQPTWELSDATLGALTVDATGMGAIIAHSGGVGEVTMTIRADGDLGAGVFPIVISEVFTMLAPLGAVGGSAVVGVEEPITP